MLRRDVAARPGVLHRVIVDSKEDNTVLDVNEHQEESEAGGGTRAVASGTSAKEVPIKVVVVAIIVAAVIVLGAVTVFSWL